MTKSANAWNSIEVWPEEHTAWRGAMRDVSPAAAVPARLAAQNATTHTNRKHRHERRVMPRLGADPLRGGCGLDRRLAKLGRLARLVADPIDVGPDMPVRDNRRGFCAHGRARFFSVGKDGIE